MNITYKYFFLTLFFFLVDAVFSQNSKIDSLKIELQDHKKRDIKRTKLLHELSRLYLNSGGNIEKIREYIGEAITINKELKRKDGIAYGIYLRAKVESQFSNFDKAIQNYKKAIPIFLDFGFKKSVASCYYGLGVVYYYQGKKELAIENYKKAQKINEELGNEKHIPNYISSIAIIYTDIGNYEEALVNLHKAIKLYEELNNEGGVANCWNSIAMVYNNKGNYPLALEYHNKSLSLCEEINDSIGIARSLNNIGLIYEKQLQYDKALTFYQNSLTIQERKRIKKNIAAVKRNIGNIYKNKKDYNISIKLLKEALSINREINTSHQISDCLNDIGEIYYELGDFFNALKYYEESRDINTKNKYPLGLCISYLGLAKVYSNQKVYDKSLKNALKSKVISKKLNLKDIQRDTYDLLSVIYKNTRNYKEAYFNHEKFKILSDSIFNKKNIEKIAQLEYEYKYKQVIDSANVRELQLTKTVTVTNKNLERSQRNLLLGVIAFLVTILILGGIIFFLKLRNEKSKTQNIVIEQKLLRSQMTPHFIFNSLSVLQGMILNKEEKNAVSYLSKFSKLMRTILENSRHKTVVLSEELSAINSYMALQNLGMKPPFEYKLTVDFNVEKTNFKIPPMLIQPFIENAIEHAFPDKKENKEINVTLVFKEEKLICTIKDNGIGIDEINQKSERNKNSLATTITSERLVMLSKEFKTAGTIEVKNRKIFGKEGTLVTLVIPYKIESV